MRYSNTEQRASPQAMPFFCSQPERMNRSTFAENSTDEENQTRDGAERNGNQRGWREAGLFLQIIIYKERGGEIRPAGADLRAEDGHEGQQDARDPGTRHPVFMT